MLLASAPMIDPTAAQLFGALGLAARVASPLFSRRDQVLTAQALAAGLFAESYALMGQMTATSVCLIGAAQTIVALIAGERPWLRRLGYLLVPAVVVLGAATFSDLSTILAVSGCCLMMIGRLQRDLRRMRGIQICASPSARPMTSSLVHGSALPVPA